MTTGMTADEMMTAVAEMMAVEMTAGRGGGGY